MNEPGLGPKWQRRKADRPAEILAAALDCFAERGFSATRMDDVANKAGVKKGTVYLYFKTKEDLFKALVRSELLPNIEMLENLAQAEIPARVLLERFIQLWAVHLVPSRAALIPKLVISESGNFPDLANFYLHEVIQRAMKPMKAILRRGIERGEFRSFDVDHVLFCLIAPLLLGILWRHTFEPHDDHKLDVAALARAHLDTLLHGLCPGGDK